MIEGPKRPGAGEPRLVERVPWRRRLKRAGALDWALEWTGVGLVSAGMAQVEGWLGLIVVGGYLALLANVERGGRRDER